jgi:hypothetical protein
MKPTHAQIEAEPAGRQLNEWVAVYIMGWRKLLLDDTLLEYWAWENEQGVMVALSGEFCPSTSIKDVWLVAEKVTGNIDLHGDYHTIAVVSDCAEWLCVIDQLEDDDERYESRSCSAPLAICKASLYCAIAQPFT